MKCDVCKQDKDITEFDANKTTCKECVEKSKKKRERMIQQLLDKAAEIDEKDRNKKKDDGYGIV